MKYAELKKEVKQEGACFVGYNDVNDRFYVETWAGESGTYLLIKDKFLNDWEISYHRTSEGIRNAINQLNKEGVTL